MNSGGSRRRVLVIDDDVDAAESLADVLRLCGHAVEVAYGGPEGIQRSRDFVPDLVLCELELPGRHCGCEVARALRADPLLASTRLILMTGSSGGRRLDLALKAGFDEHLLKAADLDELIRIVAGDAPAACCTAARAGYEVAAPAGH